mmetsp:Transcript_64066/g.206364  ORF Transcript_64066/g.206364 Transcript_64066/m.206364 type:complete len:756 (+) Transcript_64066:151-2418(+)
MGCFSSKSASPKQPKLLDKYTLGKVLGQGAFGIVYQCKSRTDNGVFAVKMIDKVETPQADIELEAELLRKYAGPRIVKLRELFLEKAFVCMVMDFHEGGDMIEGMQAHWKNKGALPLLVISNVSRQMVESIAWLHKFKVVHRDVKGDNYLMSTRDIADPLCCIFLSDFGTVREVGEDPTKRLTSKCGTKTYWAPEFYSQNYSLPVDVWAIGVVMYGLVTGRFPFKGETDVRSKPVPTLARRSKDSEQGRLSACTSLLEKMLAKKEEERITAVQALDHPFIPGTGKIDQTEVTEEMEFEPEVREAGANAGVSARRKELVERLEDLQKKVEDRQKKDVTLNAQLNELKNTSRPHKVMDTRKDTTSEFKWMDASQVEVKGKTIDDSQNGIGLSEQDIKQMFKQMLGDSAKEIETQSNEGVVKEFMSEVQTGASRLMLDAACHKKVVRTVDLVLLRICYKTAEGIIYLVQETEVFPDRRVTSGQVPQFPGTKKEPYENARQTICRLLKDRLRFDDCKVDVNYSGAEFFETQDNSKKFFGVDTVYRKEIYVGEVKECSPKFMANLKANASWEVTDPANYTRRFRWLTAKQCEEKQVKFKVAQESDISALVYPPVHFDEENLSEFLTSNKVDVTKFGKDENKALKELTDELLKGEAALMKIDSKFLRVVDVVILKLVHGSHVLVDADSRLPAVKRRPDENMFLAAHRVLSKVLKINENFVDLSKDDVQVTEEETKSPSYFNLPTLYRKRTITATLYPGDIQ